MRFEEPCDKTMCMSHILAVDQGTTGTKALILDHSLNHVAEAQDDFPQHFPQPGWVEHDLDEIWTSVQKSVSQACKKIDPASITAIGITNQRETICFWDRRTAKPLSPAIVWQDRRTADPCAEMRKKGLEKKFQEATGLLLDPYFSGTKAAWALKNWPEVQKAYKAGYLAIGTIDSYLCARFSEGKAHITEPSNASRTLAFHLTHHDWDENLCQDLGVPRDIWPDVRPSIGEFTRTQACEFLPDGIPITGVLGDQQSALLGQACISPGTAKCTYGTGAFLLMNTGKEIARSQNRLLTTIAWALSETDYTYALEGSAFIAGAAVQWVRDGLKLIDSAPEIETLAKTVEASDGVLFVPSLTGLGAPHWDAQATGMFTGLTRGTTRGHLARAVLEGIAFQNAEILRAMEADSGKKITSLNVDGGASANDLLMQFQSDILGVDLKRPEFLGTTSLGAVFAAGLGAGIWKNLSEIQKTWKEERHFQPKMASNERHNRLKAWDQAVRRVRLESH